MRVALVLCAVLALGCSEGSALQVVLVSDLRPALEIETATAELYADDPQATEPLAVAEPVQPAADANLLAGSPVGELTGVSPGTYRVRVRVEDRAGSMVASGLTRVAVTPETERVTVRISRDCVGVVCPELGGSPGYDACLGGDCVDPRCSPADRGYCPPPECVEDADCPASAEGPPCLRAACVAGSCGLYPDDSLCLAGSCDPGAGCPLGMDGGMPDAGPGMDAGAPDAGCEASPESCNGLDDDCNGEIDDGAACPCPRAAARGSTYLICDMQLPAAMARSQCQAVGYDLTSIDDQQEGLDLHALVQAQFDAQYWIGLNDVMMEGTFVWSNGSAATWRNWEAMQPDDWNMMEDCVAVSSTGTWNDIDCTASRRFVCEVP